MNTITLNTGNKIPQIGYGVFRIKDGKETYNGVLAALNAGYRHIDTATVYGNEESVGKAIKDSGVPREEIFLTTKCWNDDIRAHRTREAFFDSLKRLQTDYVDLYLIHWPADGYIDAWKEMEKLYAEGYIKNIGVSNFHAHHLDDLLREGTIVPTCDQVESNPYFNNQELIDVCQAKGIAVEAWSPLGGSKSNHIREDATLQAIAHKYEKSIVQVIIRWHLQRGIVVLPKSVHEERIKQNIDVFDFELTPEDMDRINHLNKNIRTGSNPDTFDF